LRDLLDFRQKLLNGHVERLRDSRLYKHPEGKTWLDSPNKKIEKLVEIVKERENRKVLLFCQFKEILEYLQRELGERGITCCSITGDMVDRVMRREVMDRFRFGDVNLLLATDVLDAGVDIPQGDTIVHYTFTWDAYRHRQKRERIRGGEQVFIVYEGTSEAEKLDGLLEELRRIQSRFVMEGIKGD
jgi:superfamily II DNA/RNA helicase